MESLKQPHLPVEPNCLLSHPSQLHGLQGHVFTCYGYLPEWASVHSVPLTGKSPSQPHFLLSPNETPTYPSDLRQVCLLWKAFLAVGWFPVVFAPTMSRHLSAKTFYSLQLCIHLCHFLSSLLAASKVISSTWEIQRTADSSLWPSLASSLPSTW